MAKFNLSTKGGQLSELEKMATADLPTGEAVSSAPESSPVASDITLDQLMQGPGAVPAPDVAAPVEEGIQEGLAAQEAADTRFDTPSLPDRFAAAQAGPAPTRWLEKRKSQPDEIPLSAQIDGGINGRANALAKAAADGEMVARVGYKHTPAREAIEAGDQLAGAEAVSDTSPLLAAAARAQAVTPQGTIDPNFVKFGGYVVENTMADLAFGLDPEADTDPVNQALGIEPPAPKEPTQLETQPVPKGQGDERLGNQIHQEYQRAQGVKVPDKLPPKEAAALGSAFKNMWALQNPTYVDEVTLPNGNKAYQLTALGQSALEQGAQLRKQIFPKQHVRPSKQPLVTGKLPGDVGANVVKNVSGRVGKTDFSKTIETARVNMSQVPNVVDKQRGKILLSTILPVLADPSASRDPNHPNAWMAEINNVGPKKYKKFIAAEAEAQRKVQENPNLDLSYNKDQVMDNLVNKVAQEVQAIAQDRNGANYLSYYIQAFNGRISPQQTLFDPTSSKAVRFVTRNATPSVAKPGSRVEKNLRQMYAMMLVKGADALLPDSRDAALVKASPQLEKWGDQLAAALTMTDVEYEAVSQAIADGKPLNDPVFQALKPMVIEDPELRNFIASKGEDGPHTIDGLIDYAKYAKAKRNGQPYASYFNAYIDGKTNGIASNGIQMGSRETALATGVLRNNRTTLLDDGDIRDAVQKEAMGFLRQGLDGNDAEITSEIYTLGKAVFENRDFNKHTTMTMGYGKEIESFGAKIEEVLSEAAVSDPEVANALQNTDMAPADIAKTLLNVYTPALEASLSDEALESRSLMRAAAALHSATNSLFSIKSYTGMDLNFGRSLAKDPTAGEESQYAIEKDGKRHRFSSYTYEQEATSAAARTRTDEEGRVSSTPGEYAYGGSLPGPVQSLDAATVAMSAAGKSWDRLKMNSGGNPYMHSIYDAFKTDANGFDVIVEEVNENWLKAAGEWSYLEQTYDATKNAMQEFSKWAKSQDPNKPLTQNERAYMDWFLQMTPSKTGNLIMKNMFTRMPRFMSSKNQPDVFKMQDHFKKGMAQVGYNVMDPPAQPTVAQLNQFVKLLAGELNLGSRMSSMIATTNTKKRKLIDEIKRTGYKTPSGKRIALQYYAH